MIKTLQAAQDYLIKHSAQNLEKKPLSGKLALNRTKNFLELLDNPQDKYPTVHIAGTSGKSSTAYLVAHLLRCAGKKVGLFIQPHILDLREMIQVSGKMIPQNEFLDLLNKILPAVRKMAASKLGSVSNFEILTGLAFEYFYQKHVDYAVIETGLGGLFDATNTISNPKKIVCLTKIGFDHQNILGHTLLEIATHKANIIQNFNQVFSIHQDFQVEQAILQISSKRHANLRIVNIENLAVSLKGEFQKENASLAKNVVLYISSRDKFSLSPSRIHQALLQAKFPGRFEVFKVSGQEVILDGAHNEQNLEQLLKSLDKQYPKKKFVFLIALKMAKLHQRFLHLLAKRAEKIIVTSFDTVNMTLPQKSEDEEMVVGSLKKIGFLKVEIVKDQLKALKKLLSKQEGIKVVTGSLYLVSQIRPLLARFTTRTKRVRLVTMQD